MDYNEKKKEKIGKKCVFENCNKSFPCDAKLQDHINSHLGIKPYECLICHKSYFSKKLLWAHNQIHNSCPTKCPNCNKVLLMKGNLSRHLKACSNSYKCKVCSKSYKKKFYYENHIKSHYEDSNSQDRAKHKKRNYKQPLESKKITRELVKCDICKAEYKGMSNMKAHYRAVHLKNKYKCHHCPNSYAYNISLQRHIKKCHKSDGN